MCSYQCISIINKYRAMNFKQSVILSIFCTKVRRLIDAYFNAHQTIFERNNNKISHFFLLLLLTFPSRVWLHAILHHYFLTFSYVCDGYVFSHISSHEEWPFCVTSRSCAVQIDKIALNNRRATTFAAILSCLCCVKSRDQVTSNDHNVLNTSTLWYLCFYYS